MTSPLKVAPAQVNNGRCLLQRTANDGEKCVLVDYVDVFIIIIISSRSISSVVFFDIFYYINMFFKALTL